MAKCNKCGAEVLEGALFCTECGAALTETFSETAEKMENPFENMGNNKPSSNPFADFEANVPKPELASAQTSSLIFDDPDWKKAEKIEAQAAAAQEMAAEAAAAQEMAEEAAAQAQAQTEKEQKGFFDSFKEGMAGEQPKPNWEAKEEPNYNYNGYNGQGAWSAADQQNQFNQQNQHNQYNPAGQNWTPEPIYNQDYLDMPQGHDKLWAIMSYFWVVLWLVAFFAGASGGRRSNFLNHHLNQSLLLNLISIPIGWIGGSIGMILGLALFVFGVVGIVSAAQGNTRPLPIVGNIKIFK